MPWDDSPLISGGKPEEAEPVEFASSAGRVDESFSLERASHAPNRQARESKIELVPARKAFFTVTKRA